MKIIDSKLKFDSKHTVRKSTKYIVLHHRAGLGDVESIHNQHKNANGWNGIGYHFYITKKGDVYRGRPENAVGAHVTNYNSESIGVCFEGNYDLEIMPEAQSQAGKELMAYLREKYPSAQFKRHRDLNSTACPGNGFPFKKITEKKKELSSVNDIVWELNHRGIVTDKEKWLEKLVPESNAYWLAFKAANATVNTDKHKTLSTINDIVWELNHRKIMTDKALWIKLLNDDKDLYWLALKICNQTKNSQGV